MNMSNINAKEIQKYEKKLWSSLLKKWAFCDRITITANECEMLLNEQFTEQQGSEAKTALFSSNNDERMFKDDIIFILQDKDGNDDKYIFLLGKDVEECHFHIFDSKQNLLGNGYFERSGNNFESHSSYPVGLKICTEQIKVSATLMTSFLSYEQVIDNVNKVLMRNVDYYFSIIMSLVCYIQNTKIIKEIQQAEKETAATIVKNKPRNKSRSNNSRRLTQVVYQYQQERKERHNKSYSRHVESWDVRGHYRTTKTGKRVWVKGYRKGVKKDAVVTGKDYRL